MREFLYHSPRRVRNSRKRLIAVTLVVVIVFLADIVSGGKIRAGLRGTYSGVANVGGRMGSAIKGSGIFSTRAGLEAEVASLKEQLAQYEERAAGYGALVQENDQLRAIARIAGDQEGVTAPVISSDRSSPYGTFLIGAGSADGITKGSLVVTPGGFVAGRVSDTGPHTALVSEVFAPDASIDAIIAGTPVALEGRGGENAEGKVPRGIVIPLGSPVVAPAFGNRPVGIVGHVASSSASATEDLLIRLPVNLSALQFVYVISN